MSSPLESSLDGLEIMSNQGSKCQSDRESVYSSESSGSGVTDTSTLMYSHEPFETYQSHVLHLCRDLWPTLHQDYIIERMKGGSFNRIIGIDVFGTDPRQPTRLILRVPRDDSDRIDQEVAILQYVQQHTGILIPSVVASDHTSDNALNQSYMIQNRLSGASLHYTYRDLSYEQKRPIAEQYARLLLDLQGVTSQIAGVIEGPTTGNEDFKIVHFDLGWGSEKPLPTDVPGNSTTIEMLKTQFARLRAESLRCEPPDMFDIEFWNQLEAAALEMHQAGVFNNTKHVLCHLDLMPRNIMIKLDPEVSISGVLDWDSAVFLPEFMSCAPPSWIWAWDDEEDNDEEAANTLPSTIENQQLKRLFEDVVGQRILDYMYKPEYKLARKLCSTSINGMHSNEDLRTVEGFLKDWTAFKESLLARTE